MVMTDDRLHRTTELTWLRLVEQFPDEYAATELLDGAIYDVSPESRTHALFVRRLARLFEGMFEGRDVLVLTSGSVHDGEGTNFEPDLYVTVDTRPPGEDGFFELRELQLACEVCVSTQHRDHIVKRRAYARAGVPVYWVVEPEVDQQPWAAWVTRCWGPDGDGYVHRVGSLVDLAEGVPGPDLMGG